MPARQQANQNAVDYILLTDDNFADFLAYQLELLTGVPEVRVGRHGPILAVEWTARAGIVWFVRSGQA